MYAPEEEWQEPPRVITYLRRNSSLVYAQKRYDILGVNRNPDILVMEIKPGPKEDPIYILNVYNAPMGSERAGISANRLMAVPGLMQSRSIIIGEMTLHHTDWGNRTLYPTARAKEFADWIAENQATCK